MNKKILIGCLALLSIVILSGCNTPNPDVQISEYALGDESCSDFCAKYVYDFGVGTMKDGEISNGQCMCYISILERRCNDCNIPKHKEYHKEIVICDDGKLIKSWSSPDCVDWCNAGTEKGYNMCKTNCVFEGYVCI